MSSKAKNLTPQTPGAPSSSTSADANAGAGTENTNTSASAAAAPANDPAAGAGEAGAASNAGKTEKGAGAAAPAGTVTLTAAQFEQLMGKIGALENTVSTLQATNPQQRRANPEADLPDANDVDHKAITAPVLTKQGWVVPPTFGSNPNGQKV